MKRPKTKVNYSISMNKELYQKIQEKVKNKSKYIEHLVYQDLLNNLDDEDLKNIIL